VQYIKKSFNIFLFSILSLTLIASTFLEGQTAIKIDGDSSDWTDRNAEGWSDPAGDGVGRGPELLSARAWNDAHRLYLLLEFADPVDLQTGDLRLYVDLDNDPTTGSFQRGLGVDFQWTPGEETGRAFADGSRDLGKGEWLIHAAAADRYVELVVGLSVRPAFAASQAVALAVTDLAAIDSLPDLGETWVIPLQQPLFADPALATTPFARRASTDLRIVSWNVLRDAHADPEMQALFGRVLAALDADIWLFQEMYDTSVGELRAFLDTYVPLEEGFWRIHKNFDCLTASRYRLRDRVFLDGNLAVTVETEAALGFPLLTINAHSPCCENQAGRIEEADNMMGYLKGAMEAADAPFGIILGGDLNSGSSAREMRTVLEGDLFDEALHGADFAPDWDGSGLADSLPRHPNWDSGATWRSLSSGRTSRLDYLLYSDSMLVQSRAFVVDTERLDADVRAAAGLTRIDTRGSDHLPVVLDVRPRALPAIWGEGARLEDSGWATSPWWGRWYAFDEPAFHQEHGYVWLYPQADALWVFDAELGWWWTSPEYYPVLYSYVTGRWYRYFPETSQPRWFYDYVEAQWTSEF